MKRKLLQNESIRVISVTNSNSLVHKMRIVKHFDFRDYSMGYSLGILKIEGS